MSKKSSIRISSVIILLILAFVFRNNILRSFANFLVIENEFEHIETAFVLSGGAFDRGNQAALLLNGKKIEKVICTGANQPPDFKALNLDMLESELTRKHIIVQISDSTKVTLLKIGTSTLEESEAILAFCKAENITECVIVSSKFHTRRIKNSFKKKFEKEGIKIYISGAASSSFEENNWWKSENGLIALNNEYIKLMYYLVK